MKKKFYSLMLILVVALALLFSCKDTKAIEYEFSNLDGSSGLGVIGNADTADEDEKRGAEIEPVIFTIKLKNAHFNSNFAQKQASDFFVDSINDEGIVYEKEQDKAEANKVTFSIYGAPSRNATCSDDFGKEYYFSIPADCIDVDSESVVNTGVLIKGGKLQVLSVEDVRVSVNYEKDVYAYKAGSDKFFIGNDAEVGDWTVDFEHASLKEDGKQATTVVGGLYKKSEYSSATPTRLADVLLAEDTKAGSESLRILLGKSSGTTAFDAEDGVIVFDQSVFTVDEGFEIPEFLFVDCGTVEIKALTLITADSWAQLSGADITAIQSSQAPYTWDFSGTGATSGYVSVSMVNTGLKFKEAHGADSEYGKVELQYTTADGVVNLETRAKLKSVLNVGISAGSKTAALAISNNGTDAIQSAEDADLKEMFWVVPASDIEVSNSKTHKLISGLETVRVKIGTYKK